MEILYEKIQLLNPCTYNWKKLICMLASKESKSKGLDIMDILRSNGIEAAVESLSCCDYAEWSLFNCEVAESVLPIFEKYFPGDIRPRKALQAVREHKAGLISVERLRSLTSEAWWSVETAERAWYLYGCKAAAAAVAHAAAQDSLSHTFVIYDALSAAKFTAYRETVGDRIAAAQTAYKEKWAEIEQIFIKHFGGGI